MAPGAAGVVRAAGRRKTEPETKVRVARMAERGRKKKEKRKKGCGCRVLSSYRATRTKAGFSVRFLISAVICGEMWIVRYKAL